MKGPKVIFFIACVLGAILLSQSLAQELTPEQRQFMGLPAVGPLHTTQPAVGKTQALDAIEPAATQGPTDDPAVTLPAGPEMSFRLVSSSGLDCCEWIAADGVITAATPQAFRDFTASFDLLGATRRRRLTLNSPGGDFFAALALGREIRRSARMSTAVGRTETLPGVDPSAPRRVQVGDGVCISACVLAFMGGRIRDYEQSTGPGSHGLIFASFAFDRPATIVGRASSEALSAAGLPAGGMLRLAVMGYAVEMGIDPAIAELMESSNQPAGSHLIGRDEASLLGLATPKVPITKWTLSVVRGGLALYGAGEDRRSQYKVSLRCLRKERGGLEYSIAVPVDLGTRTVAEAEDDYRRAIRGMEVTDGTAAAVPAQIGDLQVIPRQPLPTNVPRQLLLTTWLGAVQAGVVSRGAAVIHFVTAPNSSDDVIPEVSLASHQVSDAIGLLNRNCPTD